MCWTACLIRTLLNQRIRAWYGWFGLSGTHLYTPKEIIDFCASHRGCQILLYTKTNLLIHLTDFSFAMFQSLPSMRNIFSFSLKDSVDSFFVLSFFDVKMQNGIPQKWRSLSRKHSQMYGEKCTLLRGAAVQLDHALSEHGQFETGVIYPKSWNKKNQISVAHVFFFTLS